MKKYLLLFCVIVLCRTAFSQSAFDRYYTFGTYAFAAQAVEIPSHGYYAVGNYEWYIPDSFGFPAYWREPGLIVNIDYNGDTIKTFQLFGNDTMPNFFRSAKLADDGNIFVAGETSANVPQNIYHGALWLLKITPNLDTVWSIRFSLPDTNVVMYYSDMCKLSNGGVALTGKRQNIWSGGWKGHITTFDSTGNLIFHRPILPQFDLYFYGVVEITGGGFFLSGQKMNSSNDIEPIIVKTDSAGNVLWYNIINCPGNLRIAQNIIHTQDDNYVYVWDDVYHPIGAQYYMYHYHATKIDAQGNEIWTKDYVYSYDGNQYIAERPDGKLMISGSYTDTLGNGRRALLMLCNSNGDSLWTRKFSGPIGSLPGTFLWCRHGIPTSDGGAILSGETYCCNYDSALGYHTSSMWVMKIDSLGLIELGFNEPNFVNNSQLSVPYPNPVSTQTTITVLVPPTNHNGITGEKGAQLLVFDMQGRQLQKHALQTGLNTLTIDVSSFANGEYLCVLSLDGYNAGGKKLVVSR